MKNPIECIMGCLPSVKTNCFFKKNAIIIPATKAKYTEVKKSNHKLKKIRNRKLTIAAIPPVNKYLKNSLESKYFIAHQLSLLAFCQNQYSLIYLYLQDNSKKYQQPTNPLWEVPQAEVYLNNLDHI